MKKFLVLIVCLIICTMAHSQVACQFRYLEDGRMYLVIQNQSQYNFNATGAVYRNNRLYNSEVLSFRAGSAFILGPSTPWRWQWHRGDTYVITYPNGQRASWTCSQTDTGSTSIPFKGKHCSGTVGCSCSGFSPITDGTVYQQSICKKCKHAKSCHK